MISKDIYVNSGEMNESNLVLHRTNNAGDVTVDLSAVKQTKALNKDININSGDIEYNSRKYKFSSI